MFIKKHLNILFITLALFGCEKHKNTNHTNNDNSHTYNNQQDTDTDNIWEDDGELESKTDITTTNPCLQQSIIQSIKSSIIEQSEKIISLKYNKKELNPDLLKKLNSTNIVFNHISEPTTLDNGETHCTATIETTYIGDENTNNDILRDYIETLNLRISDLILPNLGINKLNINQFNFDDIDNNGFSQEVEYIIKNSYSENGELQTTYKATTTQISQMLATLAIVDMFLQEDNKKKSETKTNDENNKPSTIEDKPDYIDARWTKKPNTSFPEAAKRYAKPGEYTTTLKLTVGKDGKIKGVDVVSSSGIDIIDREAQKQVRSGRLKPFIQNGVPVEAQITIPLRYVLKGDTQSPSQNNTKENSNEDYQSSKLYLNNAYTSLEDKGLVTDELIEQQKEWLRKRNSQCGNDNTCKYKLNMARADEFLEMARDI